MRTASTLCIYVLESIVSGAESQHVAEGILEEKVFVTVFIFASCQAAIPLVFGGPRKGFVGTRGRYFLCAFKLDEEGSRRCRYFRHKIALAIPSPLVCRATSYISNLLVVDPLALSFSFSFIPSISLSYSSYRVLSSSVHFWTRLAIASQRSWYFDLQAMSSIWELTVHYQHVLPHRIAMTAVRSFAGVWILQPVTSTEPAGVFPPGSHASDKSYT